MNWRHFVGAVILTSGLLLKAAAPIEAVVLGIAASAILSWRLQRAR